MSKDKISRRQFFRITATSGAVAVAAGVALTTGCGGKGGKGGGGGGENCDNNTGLSMADKQLRKTNKYVELSKDKGKNCSNCQLYKAPKSGYCGGCTVLKGTVNPKGHCTLWAKKTA